MALAGTPSKPRKPAPKNLTDSPCATSGSRSSKTLRVPVVTPFSAPHTKPTMKIQGTGTGLVTLLLKIVKCAMYSNAQKTR